LADSTTKSSDKLPATKGREVIIFDDYRGRPHDWYIFNLFTSKEEAEVRLEEILANNKKMFDATIYKLEAEQQGGDKQDGKQSTYTDKLKSRVKQK